MQEFGSKLEDCFETNCVKNMQIILKILVDFPGIFMGMWLCCLRELLSRT